MAVSSAVAGRFRIVERAGSGGMGVVYRATDEETGRPVALKILSSATVTDTQRFLREARVVAELAHQAIVRHIAHGQAEDGSLYFAMEWLDGEDLAHRLARGPLAPTDAARVASRVAVALAHAHERGVVHRDVKPSNVFLCGESLDDVRLLDFGIARSGSAATRLTGTGAFVGTPSYMAPEQASASTQVDHRADLFGLGCVLYECIVGAPAFGGETLMAVLAKILFADAPHLRADGNGLLEGLDELVQRLVAKDPSARPRSAREVAEELSVLARGAHSAPPVPAHAVGPHEQRVLAVVLGATDDALRAPTIPMSPVPSTPPGGPTPSSIDAEVHTLPDGSVLCLVRGGSARDQAAAAVRSALALRRLRPELAIAVATGRATTGTGVPMGDAIDRAASLLASGRDERVQVDAFTAELIAERYEVARHDGRLVVVGPVAPKNVERQVLGRVTTCVGRTRELTFLRGLLDEAKLENVARVALVTGPAGIGKSRLRRELVRGLTEESAWAVWSARGEELGVASPYAILGQMVRTAFDAQEGADSAIVRAIVERRVSVLGAADSAFVAAFLCEVAGIPLPSSAHPYLAGARADVGALEAHVATATRMWLGVELRDRPVLLVMEDLHWGDAASISAVGQALRALHDRPLALLALARPELHERFPRVFAAHGASEVRLGPIGKSAARQLAVQLVGDSADVVETIVGRAEGVPLMLEELARANATAGVGDAQPLAALIEARLLELPSEERRFLRAASVFGVHAWIDGVAALTGTTHENASVVAGQLVEREVLVPVTSRFTDQRELAFRHALLRDVAYEMLPPTDRRAAHLAAATWLTSRTDLDRVVYATHLERGADSEGERESAIDAILALSDRVSSQDLTPWLARARLHAAGIPAGPKTDRLALRIIALECRALLNGDHARTRSRADDWIALAERLGDPVECALAYATRAIVRANEGDTDGGAADTAEARRLIGPNPEPRIALIVMKSGLLIEMCRTNVAGALDGALETLRIARTLASPRERVVAAHNAGDSAMRLGRFDEARRLLHESQEANAVYGYHAVWALNRSLLRLMDALDGDFEADAELRALALSAAASGEEWTRLEAEVADAILRAWRGQVVEARKLLQDVDHRAASQGLGMIAAEARAAVAAIDAGRRPWFRGGAPPAHLTA